MRCVCALLAVALAAAIGTAGAAASLNTGIGRIGDVEPNWTVVSRGTAYDLTIARHPAWFAPGGAGLRANWISPFVFPDGEAAAATDGDRDVRYTYSRSFERPASGLSIAWASDNAAVLRLNGRVLDSTSDWGFQSPRRLTVARDGLLAGANLLEVDVVNRACDCPNPTGVLVNVAPVPLPETSVLLVAGLGILGIAARRRARAS